MESIIGGRDGVVNIVGVQIFTDRLSLETIWTLNRGNGAGKEARFGHRMEAPRAVERQRRLRRHLRHIAIRCGKSKIV